MKNLTKSQYSFLSKELLEQKKQGIITEEQFQDIMSGYKENEGLNFIKVVVSVGALLIGLGILSFIASNWEYMSKMLKVVIIISALGGALFTSYKTEQEYPKTSKAFLYLSTLIYGAGIFLIGQIFQLGGTLSDAFLLWTLGVIASAFMIKDKVVIVFAHILAFVFIANSFNQNIIIFGCIIVVLFYLLNKFFNHLSFITFFSNIISLFFLLYILIYLELDAAIVTGIFFIIGLCMYYIKHRFNVHVFKLQGLIIIGISGLILTIDEIWRDILNMNNAEVIAIVFGICLVIYLLSLVKKQLLIPLVFTCAVIMRYYFDTLYDFLPKSMFFILGGSILLAFGVYFERVRKHKGGDTDERIL